MIRVDGTELRCLHCAGEMHPTLFEGSIPLEVYCSGECGTTFGYPDFLLEHGRRRHAETANARRQKITAARAHPGGTP